MTFYSRGFDKGAESTWIPSGLGFINNPTKSRIYVCNDLFVFFKIFLQKGRNHICFLAQKVYNLAINHQSEYPQLKHERCKLGMTKCLINF